MDIVNESDPNFTDLMSSVSPSALIMQQSVDLMNVSHVQQQIYTLFIPFIPQQQQQPQPQSCLV